MKQETSLAKDLLNRIENLERENKILLRQNFELQEENQSLKQEVEYYQY